MNSRMARQLYEQRFDGLSDDEREKAIQQIHDHITRDQREKIEHVYAEYRRQIGTEPAIILVDVLYDEFGERLGVHEYGAERISDIQQKAFYGNGFAPIIFAFSPQDACNILREQFPAHQADAALVPAPPGKVKLFVCSMGALSGYDAVASPD